MTVDASPHVLKTLLKAWTHPKFHLIRTFHLAFNSRQLVPDAVDWVRNTELSWDHLVRHQTLLVKAWALYFCDIPPHMKMGTLHVKGAVTCAFLTPFYLLHRILRSTMYVFPNSVITPCHGPKYYVLCIMMLLCSP